jgi:hypothetical protein
MMADLVNGLAIRKRLGASEWSAPILHGRDGFAYTAQDHNGIVIVTGWYEPDDPTGWIHASMSRMRDVPSYADLKLLHQAVWPDGHAYQCFVPPAEHVNLHDRVLHLWGHADGARILPNFAQHGSI